MIIYHKNKNNTISTKDIIIEKLNTISIQKGNKKLMSNENIDMYAFSILGQCNLQKLKKDGYINSNIPNIICPGSTKLCTDICYNGKYYFRTTFINGRISNFLWTLESNFVNIISKKINNFKTKKKIIFRVHVEGDFYSLDYFLKWIDIVKQCNHVHFYVYTKSYYILQEYIDKYGIKTLPNNFNILLSYFSDTEKQNVDIIMQLKNKYGFNIVTNFNIEKAIVCNNDCINCKQCFYKKSKNIYIPIH